MSVAVENDPYLSAVLELMSETRAYFDALEIIPRRISAADAILLGLVSKSVVLTEAIVNLAKNNFGDEAFGLCRSSVELQLTVRYLTNREVTRRTNRYFHYFAKDKVDWLRLIAKYYPDRTLPRHPEQDDIERLAAEFRSPHKWSDCPGGLKGFAEENDEFQSQPDGSPVNELFYYEILYKWMSHYVHITEPSIEPVHITLPGDCFRIPNFETLSSRGYDAVRVSFTSVLLNLIRVFRYFNMDLSNELHESYDRVIQMRGSTLAKTPVKS